MGYPIAFLFTNGSSTISPIPFISGASILILVASHYFSSNNALDKVLGIGMVVTSAKKPAMGWRELLLTGYHGCLVHSLVPFLKAKGKS